MSIAAPARVIPFARPWITEEDRRAVAEVLEGHILTHGPQGQSFEAEFAAFLGPEVSCVTVSSCMAALHLAYLHFGIGPGDEVIVPAQTHAATVHAVEWVGATPVFVDCDPATGNVTAEGIAAAVTPRTKAIGLVHFIGIPCDMPRIMALAQRHDLKVIEDCAIALGARHGGRHVGLFGDAGCFSFYPVKHLTTGEGGMFVSRHPAVAGAVARLRAFGVDRSHTERAVPGLYDVPSLGLNYRMSELQAALGRSQLRRIDENLARRRAHFTILRASLRAVPDVRILEATEPDAATSHYCLSVVLEGPLAARRNAILAALTAAGVGTSVYYPHPVPRLQYYRARYGYDASRWTQAQRISDQSIALPVGPHLADDDVEYVAQRFIHAVEES
ncbi:MAG: DegT/DnrJ/EryC1/StrS family aminotransferase [Candidatus Omnitrophica bacterium]|nr:DegT/DnrJ/EryC1/StrS family aminotransferase [Candidatus Omnitrophota bacterium]